jgi:Tfp pilus assembly protein PilN
MFQDDAAPDPTTAVIAHSLISSVAVVSSAIQSLLTFGEDLGPAKREELLHMALTQAEYMSEVLKDLARGLPPEVIDALDAIAERRPLNDA